ncbi:hypothetical protein LguiA_034681 [Lonicera macranthoides]
MKGSFGGSGGMGSNGGGAMFKTVFRKAIRASATDPFSNSTITSRSTSITRTPTDKNTISVSKSSSINSLNLISSTGFPDDFEWVISECDDNIDDQLERDNELQGEINGYSGDSVFGSVPSVDEVQQAVSSLQQVLDTASVSPFIKDGLHYYLDKDVVDQIYTPTDLTHRVYSSESESDWIEPPLHLCNSRMLESRRSKRVYDAFHLLQTVPAVKRMVISISSDKAVWDAVLNNEVVRELRESLNEANSNEPVSADEASIGASAAANSNVPGSSNEASNDENAAMNVLSWIFINTKAKMMALIDKITGLVNELFQHPGSETTMGAASEPFEKNLRASFMVSVVVFLIVVVSRSRRA